MLKCTKVNNVSSLWDSSKPKPQSSHQTNVSEMVSVILHHSGHLTFVQVFIYHHT